MENHFAFILRICFLFFPEFSVLGKTELTQLKRFLNFRSLHKMLIDITFISI